MNINMGVNAVEVATTHLDNNSNCINEKTSPMENKSSMHSNECAITSISTAPHSLSYSCVVTDGTHKKKENSSNEIGDADYNTHIDKMMEGDEKQKQNKYQDHNKNQIQNRNGNGNGNGNNMPGTNDLFGKTKNEQNHSSNNVTKRNEVEVDNDDGENQRKNENKSANENENARDTGKHRVSDNNNISSSGGSCNSNGNNDGNGSNGRDNRKEDKKEDDNDDQDEDVGDNNDNEEFEGESEDDEKSGKNNKKKKNKSKNPNKKNNKNKNKKGNLDNKMENITREIKPKTKNLNTVSVLNEPDNISGDNISDIREHDDNTMKQSNTGNTSDVTDIKTNTLNSSIANGINRTDKESQSCKDISNGKENNCINNEISNNNISNNIGKIFSMAEHGNISLKNNTDNTNSNPLTKSTVDNSSISKGGNKHNTKSTINDTMNQIKEKNNLENSAHLLESESNENSSNPENKNTYRSVSESHNSNSTINNSVNSNHTTKDINGNDFDIYANEKTELFNKTSLVCDESGNNSTNGKLYVEEQNKKEVANANLTMNMLKTNICNFFTEEYMERNENLHIKTPPSVPFAKGGNGIQKNKANEQKLMIDIGAAKYEGNNIAENNTFAKIKKEHISNLTDNVFNNRNGATQKILNHVNLNKPDGNELNYLFLHKNHITDINNNISHSNLMQNKSVTKAYINNLINSSYAGEMTGVMSPNSPPYIKDSKNNFLHKNYLNVLMNNSGHKSGGTNIAALKNNTNMYLNSSAHNALKINNALGGTFPSYGSFLGGNTTANSSACGGIANRHTAALGNGSAGNLNLNKTNANCNNLVKSLHSQNGVNKLINADINPLRNTSNPVKENFEFQLQKKGVEELAIERPVILNNSQMLEAFMEGRLCLSCDSLDHPMPLCPNNSFVCPNCHNVSHRGNDCPMKCRFCLKYHTGISIMDCLKKARIQNEKSALKQDKNDLTKFNKTAKSAENKTSMGPRFDITTRPDNSYGRSVYVSNLSDDITDTQLRDTINYHLDNGFVVNIDRQDGYAFVELSNLNSTFQLVQKSITINYKKLKIQFKKTGQFLIPDHLSMTSNPMDENILNPSLNVPQHKNGKNNFNYMLNKTMGNNNLLYIPGARINLKGTNTSSNGNTPINTATANNNNSNNSPTVSTMVSPKISENGNIANPNFNENGIGMANNYAIGEMKNKTPYNKLMFHKGTKLQHILQAQMQLQLLQAQNNDPNASANPIQQGLLLNTQNAQMLQQVLPPPTQTPTKTQTLAQTQQRRPLPPHTKLKKKQNEIFNYPATDFSNISPTLNGLKDINKSILQKKDAKLIGDKYEMDEKGVCNAEYIMRQPKKDRANMIASNYLMSLPSVKGTSTLSNLNDYLLQTNTGEDASDRHHFRYAEDALLNEYSKKTGTRKYQSLYFNGSYDSFIRGSSEGDANLLNTTGGMHNAVGTEKDTFGSRLFREDSKLKANSFADLNENEFNKHKSSLGISKNPLLGATDASESLFNAQLFKSLSVHNYLQKISELSKKENEPKIEKKEEKTDEKIEEKTEKAEKLLPQGEKEEKEKKEEKDKTETALETGENVEMKEEIKDETLKEDKLCSMENGNSKANKINGNSSTKTNVDNAQSAKNRDMVLKFLSEKDRNAYMYHNLDIQNIINNAIDMNNSVLNFNESTMTNIGNGVDNQSNNGGGSATSNPFSTEEGNVGAVNAAVAENTSASNTAMNITNRRANSIKGQENMNTERGKYPLASKQNNVTAIPFYNTEVGKDLKKENRKNNLNFKEKNINLNEDNSNNICNDMFFGNDDLYCIISKLNVSKIIDSNSNDHNITNKCVSSSYNTTCNTINNNKNMITNLFNSTMLNEGNKNNTHNLNAINKEENENATTTTTTNTTNANNNTTNTNEQTNNLNSTFNSTLNNTNSFNTSTDNTLFHVGPNDSLSNNQKMNASQNEKKEDNNDTRNTLPDMSTMLFTQDKQNILETPNINKIGENGTQDKKTQMNNENVEYLNEDYMKNMKYKELDAIEQDLERHIKALWNLRNYRLVNHFGIPNN